MEWMVSVQRLKLFPHMNADKLEVASVGDYQVVVRKGEYVDGQEVVFVPEKSVLTGDIKREFEANLAGPERDRVGAVCLRGEMSYGIILPPHLVPGLDSLPRGEDVSGLLGISRYVPTIPDELLGKAVPCQHSGYKRHDVLSLAAFRDAFTDGEEFVVTEKVNGTQCVVGLSDEGHFVSSKGLLDGHIVFAGDEDNVYTRAGATLVDGLRELKAATGARLVQAFGEIVPVVSGFHYGIQNEKRMLVFRVSAIGDGERDVPYDDPVNPFSGSWVPVLMRGRFSEGTFAEVAKLASGKEAVSGRSLHISEGVVIAPYSAKRHNGKRVFAKMLNPKYKPTGEEIS